MNKQPIAIIFLLSFWVCLRCDEIAAQVNFTSSNLPIILITTKTTDPIPDEPKIAATMGIIAKGGNNFNSITDQPASFQGMIGIERRGNSSQYFADKKPYSIELRDEKGDDLASELLGMPKESDWILLAPYADKSLMRDALAYKWASSAMEWAPRTRFVEVVLNGEYQGVYVLLEKIKRDKNRVNIAKLEQKDNNDNSISGGYIISLDVIKPKNNVYPDGWYSPYEPPYGVGQKIFYQHVYPETAEITAAQKEYIKNYITAFENTLKSGNFTDATNGYRKYIDVPSFINFLLVNELTKNTDGLRLSTYMYKDRDDSKNGGKLKMGPVWDFNLSLANTKNCAGYDASGWQFEFNKTCPFDIWETNFWYSRLMEDPRFVREWKARWATLRNTTWTTNRLVSQIDSMSNVLSQAQARNFQKWRILDKSIWPNNDVRYSYQSEINYLKDWLIKRLDWLDKNIANYPENFKTDLELTQTVSNAFPKPGEIISFTYTLRNKGNYTAEIIHTKTPLPSGLTYINSTYTVPYGFYEPSISDWVVNNLLPNEAKTLTITAKVGENIRGKLVNFGQIQTQSIGDANSVAGNNLSNIPLENDEAATTIDVGAIVTQPTQPVGNDADKIDLEIKLSADKTKLTIYQNITYTISVVNKGKQTAKNVKINCPVPYRMAYVSHAAARGSYSNWEGTWVIGTIAPNETLTFSVTSFILNPNPNTYLVQVAEASPSDIDSTPGNATNELAREDDEAVLTIDNSKSPTDGGGGVTPTPTNVDVDINLIADQTGLSVFKNITYKVIATNTGTGVATNVKIDFKLPESMAYVSHKVIIGNYNILCNTNGVDCQKWLIPSIGPKQSVTLELTLYVLSATKPITATAKLSNITEVQTNYANDQVLLTIGEYARGRSATIENTAYTTQFLPVTIANIYPIPAMDWVHLSVHSRQEMSVEMEFYDAMARRVLTQTESLLAGDNQIEVNLSTLPSGVYYVMLSSNALKSSPIKVLKQQ